MKWIATLFTAFYAVAFWDILEAYASISQAGAWETSHTVGAALLLPLLLALVVLTALWAFAEWEEG